MNEWSLIAALSIAVAAGSAVSALARQPSSSNAQKGSPITALSGCVTSVPNSRKAFTLEDPVQGRTFRLTGADVRDYVGQHVEVLGAPRKFVIVGGLYPSPNVAAQAGDYDPAKAAIAAQSGPTSNAQRPLIEFKVRSVRITPGNCPKE